MNNYGIGILDEHEPRPSATPEISNEISDEDKATLKYVEKCLERAKKHRRKYSHKWNEFYAWFRGKQWKETAPSYRNRQVINFIFQVIQSNVPIQMDSKPKFEFLPQEPHDHELADILNQVSDRDWSMNNWLYQLIETTFEANIYGTGMGSMEWNKKKNHGVGGIEFGSKDPFYCFPDPKAFNVNERANFFIYAEPVDVNELKAEYPEWAQFITADIVDGFNNDLPSRTDLDPDRYVTPNDSYVMTNKYDTSDLGEKNEVLKITMYCHSEECVEGENSETDPVTNEVKKSYVRKKKYPNGRKIVCTSKVVLEDGPNPYEDNKFPYARLTSYCLPREFWGMSEIEQLQAPQKMFNKILSSILDVMQLMGNPIYKVGTGSGVDTDTLYNKPGLIIEAEDITQVQREPGVDIPAYFFTMAEQARQYVNAISGSSEVSRGAEPNDITAASAITALQEAAQTRLRLKSRFMDAYLQELGQMYLSRIFQFQTAPEIYRITNSQGAYSYFKMHIEHPMDESGQRLMRPDGKPEKVVKVRQYFKNEITGQVSEGEEQAYQVRGEFDVKVVTGSALPFAKKEKFAVGQKMFQLGAIDQIELLKAAEWPNADEVIARMQQAAQAQAQAQAEVAPQA